MKFFASLIALLLIGTAVFCQKDDIEIFEKKDGNKSIVIARNTGKVPYMVTIDINSSGMDVTPSAKVEAVVPAGYMKEMATLQPQPGAAWSYGYNVSFIQYIGELPPTEPASAKSSGAMTKPDDTAPVSSPVSIPVPPATPKTDISGAPIIVYSQAGCSRCAYVKKEMKVRGITFVEVDVNSPSPEVNDMWKQLRDGGFTGDSVTMPVVKVDGKLHYNIKDLPGFVSHLK